MNQAVEAVVTPLTAALSSEPALVSAYLFGSLAEGRAHAESDADVGVLLDWAVCRDRASRFEVRLALIARVEAVMGRRADIVVLNDAPPQLARHILSGRRLVSSRPPIDHAFRRATMSRAADIEPFLRRMRRIKLEAIGR